MFCDMKWKFVCFVVPFDLLILTRVKICFTMPKGIIVFTYVIESLIWHYQTFVIIFFGEKKIEFFLFFWIFELNWKVIHNLSKLTLGPKTN
jgi:hypothetical protein